MNRTPLAVISALLPWAFVCLSYLLGGVMPGYWLVRVRTGGDVREHGSGGTGATNVGRLGLAWSYDTQSLRGLEATPLMSNGVLYASTPWSNVFALDARTGRELWRWDAKADRIRGSRASMRRA